jgi:hypothetical protein
MGVQIRWSWVALLATMLLLAGCGYIPAVPLKTYAGEELSEDQVATLDWCGFGNASWEITVDDEIILDIFHSEVRGEDHNYFWSGLCEAKILPGVHKIEYSAGFYKTGVRRGSATVELLPGHIYYFQRAHCMITEGCMNYKATVWIEDEDGNVIHGSKNWY